MNWLELAVETAKDVLTPTEANPGEQEWLDGYHAAQHQQQQHEHQVDHQHDQHSSHPVDHGGYDSGHSGCDSGSSGW